MRDTDSDWISIAERHPYYGVLTNERFLHPSADDLMEFFATGDRDIAHLLTVAERQFGQFNPKSALDFGCGVGRLIIPLARMTGSATGVDVADAMLALAQTHADDAGVDVELLNDIPTGRQFDWVNTMIVLQHIPPARGYGIIRKLWAAVAPGGLLTLQLTIYKDAHHTGELQRDLTMFRYDGETLFRYPDEESADVGMSMYDYDLSRVFCILALHDGQAVHMEKTDHGGCHGFRIYVRKR